ncbi:MAG: radical SAM protein [Tepidisphaera sp.]|nr:radical SAM protein [Tepidisphaera sp.]
MSATLSRMGLPPVRRDPGLDVVREKIANGQRLTLAEGDLLFTTPDIWTVIELADQVRRRLHGNAAYYNVNRHLNYSNVCALSCKFCEFYRKAGEDGAYTRDMDYVRQEARKAVEAGATEVHSVGGLHPTLPFSYYTDLISTIRDEATRLGSDLHVKAFTAVEIVHLARIAKVYKGASAPGEEGRQARRGAIRHVLSALKAAGLGSLPGGGAEVFDDRVHDEAYKGKIRSDVWLDVHRVAHELDLNTNATMLYGHIETRHDRLVHMDMLRRAQDEALARLGYAGVDGEGTGDWALGTGEEAEGHLGYVASHLARVPAITLTRPGTPLPEHVAFTNAEARMPNAGPSPQSQVPSASGPRGYYQTIIPLPFFPDGCDLEHLPGPSGLENYRTIAVARLMLDNFPHVKAFWIMQTLPMTQVMLQSGADDVDGTVVWYDITKLNHAGQDGGEVKTHQEVTPATLQRLIRDAGFEPIERDTLYRRVVREGNKWRVAAAVASSNRR